MLLLHLSTTQTSRVAVHNNRHYFTVDKLYLYIYKDIKMNCERTWEIVELKIHDGHWGIQKNKFQKLEWNI